MGFEVNWTVGLGVLLTCQGKDGVYVPISALGWLFFTIDTKAFLGEEGQWAKTGASCTYGSDGDEKSGARRRRADHPKGQWA